MPYPTQLLRPSSTKLPCSTQSLRPVPQGIHEVDGPPSVPSSVSLSDVPYLVDEKEGLYLVSLPNTVATEVVASTSVPKNDALSAYTPKSKTVSASHLSDFKAPRRSRVCRAVSPITPRQLFPEKSPGRPRDPRLAPRTSNAVDAEFISLDLPLASSTPKPGDPAVLDNMFE